MITDVKHVDIAPIIYEPECKKYTLVQRFGKHLMCGASKARLNRAEKVLRCYNIERHKVAMLVCTIARQMEALQGDEHTNIEMNIKKEDLYTDSYNKLRDEMSKLRCSFKAQIRCMSISSYAVGLFCLLGSFVGMYLLIAIAYTRSVALLIFYFLFISIAYAIFPPLVSAMKCIENRLKCAINEKCLCYFDDVCNSLQFVSASENGFLYEVKKLDDGRAKIAHSFASSICEANRHRFLMHKTFDSSERLLYHNTI